MIVFAVSYVDVLDLTHARFTCMLCKICKYGSFCGILMYFVVGYPNIQVSTTCIMYIDMIYLFIFICIYFLFFKKDGGSINTHSLDIVVYIICDSIISCLSFMLQYLHTNVQRCMSAWNRDAGW